MDRGTNLHRHIARIDTLEFFVNIKNATKLAIQFTARNMRQVEVDALAIRLNAEPFVNANVENFPRREVARYEIAIG